MSPQPAFDDPDYVYFWQGRTTGAIWECWMGSMWKGKPYWADSPPDAPDAQAMAVQAMAQLRLSPIRVGMVPHPTEQSPDSIGLVGRSVWMWAESPDAGTVGPKSITVTDGPYSVGLNARVDKIVWDMGDGTQITCKGPGTVWTPTQAAGNRRSPTCGHVYEKQGPYTVTATTHWVVNWAALDQHGQFNFTLTSTVHVLLGELQVVSRHK